MSVTYATKDITLVGHGIVAHGVNCQGKLGSGVAGALRKQYPQIFAPYADRCRRHVNKRGALLGQVVFVPICISDDDTLIIAHCFTQEFYGYDGSLYACPTAITSALNTVCSLAKQSGLPVYVPMIGCGLGGLDWDNTVRPIVEHLADTHDVDIIVCSK